MENFQNQPQNFELKPKKEFPSWVGILVVLIAAIIVGGGIMGCQYYFLQEQNINTVTIEKPASNFSNLNKNDLLYKLFPNLDLEFINGTTSLVLVENSPELRLYLKDSKEGYFFNSQEKSLLLIVNLDGMPHVMGLYHSYLGLFDKNGNLLTLASTFPGEDSSKMYEGEEDSYDFSKDPAHFGGDNGVFGFNDCNGITYITFIGSGCPNSTCCFDSAKVYKFSNGKFENIQEVKQESYDLGYALKMSLSGDKLTIKKVPDHLDQYTNECTETDYKVMNWDKTSCTFKSAEAQITKEESCSASGGKVETTTCYCSSTSDFYNSCLIGGCACTPSQENARQIKTCNCGEEKCFDGNKCVSF